MAFFIVRILLIIGFVYGVYYFLATKNKEKKETKNEETPPKKDSWSDF